MKRLLIVFVLSIGLLNQLHAQNKSITGRVVDEDLMPIPLVFIEINDTLKVGQTDLNGFFQVNIPITQNTISFNFLGMEPALVELTNSCNEVEVVLMFRSTYDFMSFKKIDRLRKKRFKKLPGLQKEAFEKGIFKKDSICYTRVFRPYYKSNKVFKN